MKLALTSRKITLFGRRHRALSAALCAALVIASCGGRAKDQREPGEPSAGAGGADSTSPTGGTSSGGAGSGGQTEARGTGSSQGAGGSFGGSFELSDLEGSCRYVECDGCFRCVELYNSQPGCGLPVSGTTAERTDEPCPREGLIGVCIEGERISYYYENPTSDLEFLEEACNSLGTFVRP